MDLFERYLQHVCNCRGYMRDYDDSETRTNMNFSDGYVQLLCNCWGCIRMYDDIETRTNIDYPEATSSNCATAGAIQGNMTIVKLEPTWISQKVTSSTCATAGAT